MLTHRLYIASPDAPRLERLLAAEPDFALLGSQGAGQAAIREILRLCPDALILDSVLEGMDGVSLLQALRGMASPPRVLYLMRTNVMPQGAEVDDACAYPDVLEDGTIADMARRTALRPLPALAKPWEEARREIAEALLERLRVSPRLRGRNLMQSAIAALSCAPQLAASFSGRLYPFIASEQGTTPSAAERAIRTAVEDTWLRGDLGEIQRLFGFTVDADRGKPTNAEFLTLLAEHARWEMMKRMQK